MTYANSDITATTPVAWERLPGHAIDRRPTPTTEKCSSTQDPATTQDADNVN
ncbi:hypothetical protein AAVH_10850, partial [Aphelenchoides avenae]